MNAPRGKRLMATLTPPPWPWKVLELGPVGARIYYITDAKDKEVARFFGHQARQNCELFMELRALQNLRPKQNEYATTTR